jgi:hypothetical protein
MQVWHMRIALTLLRMGQGFLNQHLERKSRKTGEQLG